MCRLYPLPHVRGLFPEHDENKVVPVLVGRQPGKPQDAFHHLVAMVPALFGVHIKDFPFVRRQARRIVQHLVIGQCRCNDGGDVERLLAFRLACGGAEVAQRPDGGAMMVSPLASVLFLFSMGFTSLRDG